MKQSRKIYMLSLLLALWFSGCSGTKPTMPTIENNRLPGCPDRPNCVSSEAQDDRHAVAPLRLKGDPEVVWAAIQDAVGNLPRSRIVTATDRYLHVECKSRLFGFIDDLELQLDPATGVVAVRSASRIGYSDLGVNRKRVEALRHQLMQKALIH